MKLSRLKVCLLLTLVLMSLFALCSCFDIDDMIVDLGLYQNNKRVNNKFTVVFRECDGVMLDEDDEGAVRSVTKGTNVKFKVKISDNYIYLGNTVGAQYKDGVVTLEDVSAPVTIDLILIAKSELYCVDVYKNHNAANVVFTKGGAWAAEPTEVTLRALTPTGYIFRGWSSGNFLVNNGVLLSTEEEYTFTPAKDERMVKVYANFESEDEYKITYDPNGGLLNGFTDPYTLVKDYSDAFLLQQTLYEGNPDVILTRDGYQLIGYSTEPTTSYSDYDSVNSITGFSNVGGVCEVPRDEGRLTLYAVWAQETTDAAFTTEQKTYDDIWYADDRNGNKNITLDEVYKSPTSGIVIKKYNPMYNSGSKDTIVIPEKIDGKTVIGIAAGAFDNMPAVKKIVIPKTVRKIENGAFSKAAGLREVVFFDSLQYVYNSSFTGNVTTIVMNSTKLPTYAGGAEGSFCIKYERIRYYRNEKKLIVVSGSSSLNGLNSKMLEDNLNGEYQIINYGTNAGTQGLFYIEAFSKYIGAGDIVVHAPEWGSGGMMGDTTIQWKMFRGNNQCYDIFREVNMSNYSNFWDAYVTCQIGKALYNSNKTAYGKYSDSDIAGLQIGKEYQAEPMGMNKYGDLLGSRQSRTYTATGTMMFTNQLNQTRANNCNRVNGMIVAQGGTMLYSFGTADAIKVGNTDASWKNKADEYTQKCVDLLDYHVISNVGTYVMGEKDYSVSPDRQEIGNSEWHCTYYGANVRTVELTYDIKKYLGLTVKTDSWETYNLRESHRTPSAYKVYAYSD